MTHSFPLSLMAVAVALCSQSIYAQDSSAPVTAKIKTQTSSSPIIEEIIVEGEALDAVKILSIKPDVINQPDSAATLKALPGANINSNGPITGIAQYRGLFGDRVAVSMENEAVLGGGPNAMDTPLSYAPPTVIEVHRTHPRYCVC